MKRRTKGFIIGLAFTFAAFLSVQPQFPVGGFMQTAIAAENYSKWNSTTIYNNGDIVSYDGKLWVAQWWTEGQVPGTTGEWGVWKVYSSGQETTTDPTQTDTTTKKLIALTFDDGPSETTKLVLDKLEKYNVVGSFFLVGQVITDYSKATMQRELSLGCEIDSHSWSHSFMNSMSSNEIINEMQKTSDTIYNMAGVRPKFFRPPYIATSNTMYEAIDIPFICGIACTDWDSSVRAEDRAATILNNAKDGDIVLLHDSYGNTPTVEALDAIIQGLKDKGFTFVTVSQLFEQKGVESNVEYKLWTNVIN